MSRPAKTLARVLRGDADANIAFNDLVGMLISLGFTERIKGGHHIFTYEGVEEILNLQPRAGKAKPYQVGQVRDLIISYGLTDDSDDDNETDEEDTDDT